MGLNIFIMIYGKIIFKMVLWIYINERARHD